MIDIENQIFTDVKNGFANTDYANITIFSDPPEKPKFPCVMFFQSDAKPVSHYASRADIMEEVTFTADIYSNKANGAKTECKEIATIIDNTMRILGFTRISSSPSFSMPDLAKARRVLKYRAIADSLTYTDGTRTRNFIHTL